MIETIQFNNKDYPLLQTKGFAAKFSMPFAEIIIGKGKFGYDIGCKSASWSYPGAALVDPEIDPSHDAMKLPEAQVDYIHSSHALEHFPYRVGQVLQYWLTKLRKGGVIFLYLPNMDHQEYWAFENEKHLQYINPTIMEGQVKCLESKGLISKWFVTPGCDLNSSFYCVIEK